MTTLRLLALLAVALVAHLPGQIPPITYNTVSYHGYTGTQHQTQFNLLQPNGYRPLSLSVAGGLSGARYSAVWIQQSGPNWAAVHGVTKSQYQAQATAWTNAGYRAKIVAASGVGSNAVFAAVWVQDGAAVGHFDNLQIGNLATTPDGDDYLTTADSQAELGRRLVSCASYRENGIDRWVAVFEPDPTNIAWGVTAGDDLATWGYKFGEYTLGEARPSFVSVSDSQLYTTVYRDDRIGNWQMVVGRTAAQLTADKVTFDQQGLFPVCIAAGGTGTGARYSAIFVERLSPIARAQTVTGQANADFDGFDDYIESLMANGMVRSASIAVTRHGRLVHARGYTNAEPGYPITQPTSLFRIGSISKTLCGAVAHDLIASGTGNLTLDTSLVNYLGITNYPTGGTNHAGNATLRRLLRHTSGMTGGIVEPDAALWWANQGSGLIVLPCNENVVTRFACLQPFSALGQFAYSNCGNTAVGEMIQQATGLDYLVALRTRLFTPVGINVPLVEQQARPQDLAAGEVRYHLPQLYLRWQNLHYDRRLLTAQYSADYWDAAGGVVTSAVGLARVLSGAYCIGDDSPSLSAQARSTIANAGLYLDGDGNQQHVTDGGWFWDQINGRLVFHHNGGADGCSSWAVWTSDGLCIVALTNMSGTAPNYASLVAEADAVTNWPTYDLFPSYGLPTFSRTPLLQSVNAAGKPNVSESAFQFTGEGLDQVIDVRFGNTTITSQSPSDWHSGYFVKISPTRLDVHPPQGLSPGQYGVSARSWTGLGNSFPVLITIGPNFLTRAADAVPASQPFSVLVSQGHAISDVSVVFLCVSLDLLPSVYPGLLDLGIGNGFANLLISDGQWVDNQTHTARWDFPPIGSAPHFHLQAVGLDLMPANPWPLPATNVETVLRL